MWTILVHFLIRWRAFIQSERILMRSFQRKFMLVVFVLFVMIVRIGAAADPTTPNYVPGGALPPLSVFDVLNPMPQMNGTGWWYFAGLVRDQHSDPHSLQVTLFRTSIGDNHLVGVGGIAFTFQTSTGDSLYLWNLYPSMNMLIHYPVAQMSYASASQSNFHLTVQSDASHAASPFLYQFAHDTTDQDHIAGQLNARYTLSANGVAEVGAAQNQPQLVKYQLSMTLQDARGLVEEGNGGYVGVPPQVSWEFAMPNMRVLHWEMRVEPVGDVTPQSPLKDAVTFTSDDKNQNRIWLDRQVLDTLSDHPTTQSANAIQHVAEQKASQPLYHGTWMAFCLDQQPFQGICGVATAFWRPNTQTAAMNSDVNADAGFMNLYTPDSNNTGFPKQVGNALTEVLSIQDDQKELPYQIINDPNSVYRSPVSGISYAQDVSVVLKKDSVFAALFNAWQHHSDQQDIVLKFHGISQQTENSLLDPHNGFYEGAAMVSLCSEKMPVDSTSCREIGTGFLEQMGYSS